MGLTWQQGRPALSVGPEPLQRIPFGEPPQRRPRARLGASWIFDAKTSCSLANPAVAPSPTSRSVRCANAFYERHERSVGHACRPHREVDIGDISGHVVVRHGDYVVRGTPRPSTLRIRIRRTVVCAPTRRRPVITLTRCNTDDPPKTGLAIHDTIEAIRRVWSEGGWLGGVLAAREQERGGDAHVAD